MIKTLLTNDSLFPYIYDGNWEAVSRRSDIFGLTFFIIAGVALLITAAVLIATNSKMLETFFTVVAVASFAGLAFLLLFGMSFNSSLNGKLVKWAESRYGVSLTSQESKALLNQGLIELDDNTIVTLTQVEKKGQKLVRLDGSELEFASNVDNGETTTVDELTQAKKLLEDGSITQDEFNVLKDKILAQ